MRRGVVKQTLWLGLVMSIIVLALGTCGGGGGGEVAEQEEPEARTIPKPGKSLAAGRYAAKEFEPAFSFTAGRP